MIGPALGSSLSEDEGKYECKINVCQSSAPISLEEHTTTSFSVNNFNLEPNRQHYQTKRSEKRKRRKIYSNKSRKNVKN